MIRPLTSITAQSSRWLLAASLAASLALSSTAALCTPAAELDRAREEYRSAHEAMDRSDWLSAKRLLLALFEQKRSYDVAASLGQVEYRLGHLAEAAHYLDFALGAAPPKEKSDIIERLRAALTELRSQVSELQLNAEPAGASLKVDGESRGKVPLGAPLYLSPGAHRLRLEASGYDTVEREVSVKAGTQEVLHIELAASDGAPSTTPSQPPAPGPATPFQESPASQSQGPVWPVLVAGGVVTGGAFAAGLLLNAAGNDAFSAKDRLLAGLPVSGCTGTLTAQRAADCQQVADLTQRGDDRKNYATVAFVGAGVALTATLAYWLWPRGAASQPAATAVSGGAVPGRAELWLTHSF